MYKLTYTGIPCGNSNDNNGAIIALSAVLGLMVLIILGLCFGIGLLAVKGRTRHKGKLHFEQPQSIPNNTKHARGSLMAFSILKMVRNDNVNNYTCEQMLDNGTLLHGTGSNDTKPPHCRHGMLFNPPVATSLTSSITLL